MAQDEGRKATDELLAELEKRIREMYGKSAERLQEIIDEYFGKFEARDAEMKAKLDAGEITDEQYKQWRLAQIGRGKRYEAMRDKLAERMSDANAVAVAYVNDATPGIYTLNRNYAAYEIESAGAGIDFTLYDEATVRRLLMEQPDLMPYYPEKRALARGIDLAYGKKQITARITSGLLMGISTRKIAADLRDGLTNMNAASAVRTARTAITAAENGGRTASYRQASAMGVKVLREWLATHDGRTRHEHGVADGQIVGVDEPFVVGGEKLMFPGDSSFGASGWNIYNCRCAVAGTISGHAQTRETYSQWLERKMEEDPEGTTIEFKKQVRRNADYAQYRDFTKYARKETPTTFAKFQDLKYSNPNEWEKLKTVKKQRETIKNAPCQTTPQKYTGYFLKPDARHSQDFFKVGYSPDDPLRLRYDMAKQFDMSKAVNVTYDSDGKKRFRIYMELGVEKKRRFRTAWILDGEDSKPRIVTAFREGKDDD